MIKSEIRCKRAEVHLKETIRSLRRRDGRSSMLIDTIPLLLWYLCSVDENFAELEYAFQTLQGATKQKDDKLNETIYSLREDLRAQDVTSGT